MKIFLIVNLLFGQTSVWADSLNKKPVPLFNFKKKDSEVIKEYLAIHREFSKKLCTPGTEPKFWEMFRAFRGDGHYIPVDINEKLDRGTITRFVPELKNKLRWIDEKIKYLKNIKNVSVYHADVKSLNAVLDDLLEYKQKYFEVTDQQKKISARNSSKYLYIDFKNRFKDFLMKVPFLLSYRYPVNHFELRLSYDKVKHSEKAEDKIKANEIYFLRKIVQDGAQNPNRTGSDTFLRTTLDTVSILLDKQRDFITENLRYDIRWALGAIDRHIDNGVKKELRRMNEWRDRTVRNLEFYDLLREGKVKNDSGLKSGDELVKSRFSARYSLKNWVLDKQKQLYDFWSNQSEEMQALYALETTLFNEVGGIDGNDGLERRDVTQVVINRTLMDKYNVIPERDPLYSKIVKGENKGPLKTHKWLNVMLKEGEFSFTYYFIHGNVRMYCPDMTRKGRFLRKENLRISLEMLRNPRWEFEGVRYFSRASMLGRIDMAEIWDNYEPIPEKPGRLASKNGSLQKHYMEGEYDYLYDFEDHLGRAFKVVKIDDKVFVKPKERNIFYKYRNPHFFRYFRTKSSESTN